MSTISLGEGIFQKFLLTGLYLRFSVSRTLGLQASLSEPFPIRLTFRGSPFVFYFQHQVDFDVLRDVFVHEEYRLPITDEPKIIFDLGSNIGVTVIYFALKYPKAIIHAFEPDPKNIPAFRRNTAPFKERVLLHEQAVHWDTSVQKITLYQNPDYHWSSSLYEQSSGLQAVSVDTITLEQVMDEYNIDAIDIMKFDIEGAEYDLFRSFTRMKSVTWYVGEVHPHVFKKTMESFIDLFAQYELISRDGRIVIIKRKQ